MAVWRTCSANLNANGVGRALDPVPPAPDDLLMHSTFQAI